MSLHPARQPRVPARFSGAGVARPGDQGREQGIGLRERVLGNPDRTGKLGTKLPALANWSCRNTLQRRLMEKLLGIHRDKQMPDFTGETFEKWIARTGLPAAVEPAAKVAIFHTCFVNYYNTAPGKALVTVLAKTIARLRARRRIVAGCRRSTAATLTLRKSRRAPMSPRCCRWPARATKLPRSIRPAR
jgi:hypothetical protein